MIQEYLSTLPDCLDDLILPAAGARTVWDGLPEGLALAGDDLWRLPDLFPHREPLPL